MPIKIAYVINDLNIGGAEKLLLSTVKKLDKDKFDITVLSMLDGEQLLEDYKKAGVKVIRLEMKHKRDLTGLLKLYRFFKSNKTDIVHTHLLEADIFGRFAAIFAKVPVVLSTEHSMNEWKKNPVRIKSKLRLYLDRFAARYSEAIIAVSNSVKQHLMRYEKIESQKIYVIKNGIEINDRISIKPKDRHDKIIIGTMGRLFKEKGYEYLIKAIDQVRKDIPNCRLLIAGDGPLRFSLEKLTQELKLSNHVGFYGVVEHIPNFLNEIDIFALSSLREGIPLSLLEAMASAKPVISTNVGGIPEVIDNDINGILVSSGNITELKDAIISLIKDKAKRKKMGERARDKIQKNFNIDNSVCKLSQLYDKLLNDTVP